MSPSPVDPKLIERLPSVGGRQPLFNKAGQIYLERLPKGPFLLLFGFLLLVGVSVFVLVAAGFDVWGKYNGVAIQSSTNLCRPYQYDALIRNTKDPFPVEAGWKAYADIRAENDRGEPSVIIQAPYGERWCTDETFEECCRDRLHLTFENKPMGKAR